jgi:DNA-binding NarL/FixJ family response regulator
VLIVEDERIVAADLQRLLRNLGYDAYACAPSASRAWALAAQTPPELVLADIRIEGPIDGIDTAFELRRRYGSAVIFLTAHADDPTLERAKQAEPCGYLIKPVSAPAVKSAIELALHRREQESSARAIERALAQTSADLLGALNNLPLAVQLQDIHGRVVHVNLAFRLLFGMEQNRAPLIGIDGATLARHIRSLCADGEHFSSVAESLQRSPLPTSGNIVTMRDGRKLEIGYTPVFQGRQRQGQLWTYRDVTVSSGS